MAETGAKDKSTGSFLDAEEAAKELVAALEALKTETEGYINAERSLRESGERIAAMAGRLEELSLRSADALNVVKSAGGPQIVEELRGISPVLQTQSEILAEYGESLSAQAEKSARISSALEDQSKTLANHGQTLTAMAADSAQLREMAQRSNDELTTIRGEQSQATAALRATVMAVQSRIQLLVGSVAFLTVIVLILTIVLLVR